MSARYVLGHKAGLWLTVTIGMTIELLQGQTADPADAVMCYTQAIRLYSDLPSLVIPLATSFLVRDTPTGNGPIPSAFVNLREAHRWVARALCRGSVLVARQPDISSSLRFVRSYHAIADLWPTSFRPSERCFMLKLYLSALHAAYIPHPTSNPSSSVAWYVFPMPSTIIPRGTIAQLWSREIIAAMEQGNTLLSEVTEFPKAGSINWRVVEFMQACVRLWERSGYQSAEASQVIKVSRSQTTASTFGSKSRLDFVVGNELYLSITVAPAQPHTLNIRDGSARRFSQEVRTLRANCAQGQRDCSTGKSFTIEAKVFSRRFFAIQ